MDSPKYYIINPLQMELFLYKKSNIKRLSEIDNKFYDKMEKLKNISIQNKRLKYMIRNTKI
tara:strand:+ start:399 stop:581 length:183 start_codon:yes stop_codon:yes gene_type:complete